jgi:hypothetical protein
VAIAGRKRQLGKRFLFLDLWDDCLCFPLIVFGLRKWHEVNDMVVVERCDVANERDKGGGGGSRSGRSVVL